MEKIVAEKFNHGKLKVWFIIDNIHYYDEKKKNMKKNINLKSLDRFVDEQYGKKGTSKRNKFEKGYEAFKLGFLLQQARLEKGLTQEELALKCGTNKGYISKIENNIKEVRISTLQKIVKIGLGGHLEFSIKL